MKFINIINEDINHSNLDNLFYRKCLNLFSINHPEIRDKFLTKVNCSDCYEDGPLIYTTFFKELRNFFTDDLHLENNQVNDLIFLYIINLNVDNFLTDKLSTGEEFSLSYITCTDETKEDYRDVTENCSDCSGQGEVECSTCDGEGSLECGYCDGSGVETETDDEGEEQEIECSDCRGAGNETCNDCDGSGKETCGYCDGSGEWYDREHYYIMEEIQYTVLNIGDFKMPGNDDIIDFFQINKDKIYMILNKFYGDTHEEVYEADLPHESNEIIEIESYDNYVRKFGTMDIFKQVN